MAYRQKFGISTARDGTRSRIVLAGELDDGASAELWKEFEQATAEDDLEELILDMEKISFIDSAGMRAMIQIEQAARARRVPLVVMPPPVAVTELLQTTGLSKRLTMGPHHGTASDGEFIERVDLALVRDPTAPGRARNEIREFGRELSADELSTAVLLTSELVTNAVIHPAQPVADTIGLRVTTAQEQLRVEVSDSGSGFDPQRPQPRDPSQGGRGLLLVDQLASRWGAGRAGATGAVPAGGIDAADAFTVWFELDLAPGQTQARPAA